MQTGVALAKWPPSTNTVTWLTRAGSGTGIHAPYSRTSIDFCCTLICHLVAQATVTWAGDTLHRLFLNAEGGLNTEGRGEKRTSILIIKADECVTVYLRHVRLLAVLILENSDSSCSKKKTPPQNFRRTLMLLLWWRVNSNVIKDHHFADARSRDAHTAKPRHTLGPHVVTEPTVGRRADADAS